MQVASAERYQGCLPGLACCDALAGERVKAIPESWLHSLHARERIAGLADQLLLASGVTG